MSLFEKSLRRRAGSLVGMVATMAALAACGGDKSPTTPTPTPAPPPTPTTRTTQNPLGSATNVEARTSQVIPQNGANAPTPAPTASAFHVTFYADQNGQPNRQAPLFATAVPIGQTGETLGRTTARRCSWPTATC